jgi:hypothetical protein
VTDRESNFTFYYLRASFVNIQVQRGTGRRQHAPILCMTTTIQDSRVITKNERDTIFRFFIIPRMEYFCYVICRSVLVV